MALCRDSAITRPRALATGIGCGLAVLALAGPAPARAGSDPVFENYRVPTVGGAEINVDVMRPRGKPNAPVILTYSPYNTLSEGTMPNLANDDLGQRYVKRGYARAVADVLGTRNSSGCWDYGGLKETRSGVDLVNFFAKKNWSNGRVGMIGGSYDGTTANMVASRGDKAPGLKAIVPVAAISRWYGYAYSHGIRYAGNTENPTDEGADTPLAFDFGLTRTPPTDPSDPAFMALFLSRINPCDSVEHTEAGYDDSPDYNRFWVERDYRRHAKDFRAAALIAHGWQDYNVKQEEAVSLFEKLPTDDPSTSRREGAPFKILYAFQGAHETPGGRQFEKLRDKFFANTLMGADNGVENSPPVFTEGRSADQASVGFKREADWPPPSARRVDLFLRRKASGGRLKTRAGHKKTDPASYTDTASQTEEGSKESPDSEANWLFYKTRPLLSKQRMAGTSRLRLKLSVDREHAHLTPILVDIAPNGSLNTVSRGFLNLLYRNGLKREVDLPVDKPVRATATFKPQDQTFKKGHRIGVLVQSSNTAWAVPDDAGAGVTVYPGKRRSASRLSLPLLNPPGRAGKLFK